MAVEGERDRFARRERRAILAIAAVYTAFLLCAQFGFLAQLEQRLGPADAALRAVLAAMGLGGMAGGVLAEAVGGRLGATRSVRGGLLAVAAAAALSTIAARPLGLGLAAAALGGSLGFATVALAGGLGELVPRGRWGRVAGWGTGIAYAVSNLPALFAGSPAVRALAPAALCLVAAALPPIASPADSESDPEPVPWARFGGWIAAFAALVVVDSAAFAHVQATPALLAASWGGGAHQLRQGVVHLLAAVVAGALLDRGRLREVVIVTATIFAIALPALGRPELAAIAAVAYAGGISFYSAALVAAPAVGGRGRAGAAWLYGAAGWIGSGIGVGAAKAGSLAAAATIGAVGMLLFAAVEAGRSRRMRAVLAPTLLAGVALGLVAVRTVPAASAERDPLALGRSVYLAEGCQHCHSQYVRPLPFDRRAWGPAQALDRSQRPPTPGNRRIGPDLANAGLRRSELWHERHLRAPRSFVPGSRMPSYEHLFAEGDPRGPALVRYLASLGAAVEAERLEQVLAWRPTTTVAGDADRGARLFARRCAACHGPGGRGDGAAARSFTRPTLDLTKGAFFRAVPATPEEPVEVALARAIRFGLPPGTMPGFEWASEREIADLTAFVLRLSGTKPSRPGSSRPAPPG